MFEMILGFLSSLLTRIGQSSDAASATGSVHAKVVDLKSSVGNTGDAASSTGTVHAKLKNLQNSVNTIPTTPPMTSAIKSIQRGTVTFAAAPNQTITVNISSVNTAKATIKLNGFFSQTSNSSDVYVVFTNSTTLTFYLNGGMSYSNYGVEWEVVEYV